MGTTTQRSVADRAMAIIRQINAMTRTPEEWEPADLKWLDTIEAYASTCRDAAVRGMRDSGHTDQNIADALGITRQAVSKRWPGGGRYVGAAGRYRRPEVDR